jgi:hypothetical protein
MQMDRREFHKAIGTAGLVLAVGGTSIELGGCSVITDIESWIPIGLAALDSIEAELKANNVPIPAVLVTVENDVKLALADLQAAAQEYDSTSPPPVGALQKLQAALKAVTDQFGNFLAQLQLPGGGLLNLILNLAGIVFSTIAGFINRLPVPATFKSSVVSAQYRVSGQVLNVVAKERSRRAFKKDWNGELDSAKKAGVQVAPAAYMKLSFWQHF